MHLCRLRKSVDEIVDDDEWASASKEDGASDDDDDDDDAPRIFLGPAGPGLDLLRVRPKMGVG